MAKIAILGFGTVGSGVYEVLCHNAASVSRRAGEPVEVKYILDPKDFTGNPVEPLVVKNIDVILQDPEIQVVVETIGGTRFAYPYVKACLESGRSVCTSNKEMVATYGAELLALAKEHGCAFLFEASVGGGAAFYLLWELDKIPDYMKERFMVVFDHSLDPLGAGWQQTRSLLALGGAVYLLRIL